MTLLGASVVLAGGLVGRGVGQRTTRGKNGPGIAQVDILEPDTREVPKRVRPNSQTLESRAWATGDSLGTSNRQRRGVWGTGLLNGRALNAAGNQYASRWTLS